MSFAEIETNYAGCSPERERENEIFAFDAVWIPLEQILDEDQILISCIWTRMHWIHWFIWEIHLDIAYPLLMAVLKAQAVILWMMTELIQI